MRSNEFLQAAIDVQNQRAAEYDQPEGERSMGRTVQAFNAITGRELSEAEGWLFLQVLKDVRQWSAKGYHHDSALDGVAYSALKAEALHGDQKTGTVLDMSEWEGLHPGAMSKNPQLWTAGDVVKHIGPRGWLSQGELCTFFRNGEGVAYFHGATGVEVCFTRADIASNFEWVSRP
jgi:hypothetical protein